MVLPDALEAVGSSAKQGFFLPEPVFEQSGRVAWPLLTSQTVIGLSALAIGKQREAIGIGMVRSGR